ncbi:MAG: hypothetical protein ACRDSF_25730 [Pseudonocardiaceae bacterium]
MTWYLQSMGQHATTIGVLARGTVVRRVVVTLDATINTAATPDLGPSRRGGPGDPGGGPMRLGYERHGREQTS